MNSNKYPYMTEIMHEISIRAKKHKLEVCIESSTGMVMTIKGDSFLRVIMGADLGLNFSAAARLCNDKYFTADILQQLGFTTLDSTLLHSSDLSKLHNLDFPCIVKPNKGFGGEGLSCAASSDELQRAVDFAQTFDSQTLIQKYYRMREFRLVVLDGKLLYGYEKRPWQVCGDGKTSVEEFVTQYNNQVTERNKISVNDKALNAGLRSSRKSLSTVLPEGEVYSLFANANLKKGASSFAVESFAPEYVELVSEACSTLGLRYGGVDLFAAQPEHFDKYNCLIEVNANPGFEFLRRDRKLMTRVLDSLSVALFDL